MIFFLFRIRKSFPILFRQNNLNNSHINIYQNKIQLIYFENKTHIVCKSIHHHPCGSKKNVSKLAFSFISLQLLFLAFTSSSSLLYWWIRKVQFFLICVQVFPHLFCLFHQYLHCFNDEKWLNVSGFPEFIVVESFACMYVQMSEYITN